MFKLGSSQWHTEYQSIRDQFNNVHRLSDWLFLFLSFEYGKSLNDCNCTSKSILSPFNCFQPGWKKCLYFSNGSKKPIQKHQNIKLFLNFLSKLYLYTESRRSILYENYGKWNSKILTKVGNPPEQTLNDK